ncbi:MAG: flagellar brake domain-containing protein [Bacillota bacterium]
MSQSVFKVNNNIEIEIKHGVYQGVYHSRIEEIKDDVLEIAIPSKQGRLLPLPAGTWFIGKVIQGGSMYIFKSVIQHVSLQQNVPIWAIRQPQEVEKIQRREFVRMDVRLPVFVKIHVEDENFLAIEGKKYFAKELEVKEWEASTKDISGSGAKIITKFHIPEETVVSLSFQLSETDTFFTQAKIRRSELVNPDLGIYWIGVRFLGLTERERDKIVRFIFKKQAELRKRSLL